MYKHHRYDKNYNNINISFYTLIKNMNIVYTIIKTKKYDNYYDKHYRKV